MHGDAGVTHLTPLPVEALVSSGAFTSVLLD
jgi:hypothetical protein